MKIFLIGFMGSGKTHWGRLLSEKLGIRFFDLDEQISEQANKPVTAIFEEEGEENFRLLEKDVLHIITESHDSFVMACGGGTPCYYNNIDYMEKAGTTVWINTQLETIYTRLIGEKDKRPLIKDLPNDQLKNFIQKKFSDRKIYYEQAEVKLDEETMNIDKLVEKIFHV
jgi:shikimate kinase